MTNAIGRKNAEITHIALYWDASIEQWQLLSVAEDQEYIDERVGYWKSKGTQNIKVLHCHEESQ